MPEGDTGYMIDDMDQVRRGLLGGAMVAGAGLALGGMVPAGAAPGPGKFSDFDVSRFGARGDGKTDDSAAAQGAIDVPQRGAGGCHR
jgi:hypothetical protein